MKASIENFYTFPPGTCFKALIVDIRMGKITIQLENKNTFTARTNVLPYARIGEESYFRVKTNNFEGLIQLEMLRGLPNDKGDVEDEEAKPRFVFDMRV